MFRSIWVPSLIACVIGFPLLMRDSNQGEPTYNNHSAPNVSIYQSSHGFDSARSNRPGIRQSDNPIKQIQYQTAPTGNPALQSPYPTPGNPAASFQVRQSPAIVTGHPGQTLPGHGSPFHFASSGGAGPPISPAMPDYGAAETYVFSGDANGPNLKNPLGFVPVTNL